MIHSFVSHAHFYLIIFILCCSFSFPGSQYFTYEIFIGANPFASQFNLIFSPTDTVWFCVIFVITGTSTKQN